MVRFGLVSCALVSMFSSVHAVAQEEGGGSLGGGTGSEGGSVAPPAENWTISAGNVDLRTGTYVYEKTDLSLAGLELTRSASSGVRGKHDPFGTFAHNFEIFATTYQHANGNTSNPSYEPRLSVYVRGRAETFNQPGASTSWVNMSNGSGAQIDNSQQVLTYFEGDGTKITFDPGIAQSCSVTLNSGTCVYASKIESPDGTIAYLTYDAGPANTSNAARLRRISNNKGYAILLEYGVVSSRNVITKACIYNLATSTAPASNDCDSAALQSTNYTYGYVGNRVRMASATDVSNKVWEYDHTVSGDNIIQKFKRPSETTYWLTNTIEDEQSPEFRENGKITRQDFADGTSYVYGYMLTPGFVHLQSVEPRQTVGGSYQNSEGASWGAFHDYPRVPQQDAPVVGGPTPYVWVSDYQYQVTPGPVTVTPPHGPQPNPNNPDNPGGFIINDYCDRVAKQTFPQECYVGQLQRQTDPEGNFREYWWIRNPNRVVKVEHHPKPGSNEPVLTETAEYACTAAPCKAKATKTVDPKGNQSDYEYSTVHGGLLKKTLPADPNGIRPQTRYSYAQRHAWTKSGSTYVQATGPVWLLMSEEYCTSSAASGSGCSAGASDEVVTTYEYEEGSSTKGSNLLLLGMAVTAHGETLRTCYTYDEFGRKIAETQPKANLASCN